MFNSIEPTKKSRSKRKSEETRKEVVFAKAIFLVILLVGVFSLNYLLLMSPNTKKTPLSPKKPQSVVLGEVTKEEVREAVGEIASATTEKAVALKNFIEGELEQVLIEKRGVIESTVSGYLYDTTIKPLVKSFNDLPDRQKNQVRQLICQ